MLLQEPALLLPGRRLAHVNGSVKVEPVAVPALHGRDRDEPDCTKVRLGAVPALRGVAQVGLPGVQVQSLGR